MEHSILLSDLLISLLKDPSAVLELISVVLLGFYMFQVIKEHGLVLETDEDDLFTTDSPSWAAGPSLARLIPQKISTQKISTQKISTQKISAKICRDRSFSSVYSSPISGTLLSGTRLSGTRRELPAREHFGFFHRTVFSDLSDRGAIFPSRSMSREEKRKLYGVGSYISCHKRSLRKSSAKRMRLPIL